MYQSIYDNFMGGKSICDNTDISVPEETQQSSIEDIHDIKLKCQELIPFNRWLTPKTVGY